MTRVLVVSDSHGDGLSIEEALAREKDAKTVIHLGDGAAEAMRLAKTYPDRTWYIVRGNCDSMYDVPVQQDVIIEGQKLYLTHGFAEHVKSSLLRLSFAAREREAAAALYGHTHIPATDFYEGMLLLNPGSIAQRRTYCVLDIDRTGVRSTMHEL